MARSWKGVPAAVLAALAAALCLASPPPAGAAGFNWKVEKYFGKQTREAMRAEYGFVYNPILQKQIEEMGSRLVAVGGRTDIPYEFYVVDSDEVNAFAAPGGYLFVTRGLLNEAGSDDETAAVMGHETAHVAAKHGWKNIKKSALIFIGLNVLDDNNRTAANVGGVIANLAMLHYSREDEYQADELGAQYAFAAGYDPFAMQSFFRKLENEHPSGGLGKLSATFASHPKTPNRIAAVGRLAELDLQNAGNLLKIADSHAERSHWYDAIAMYDKALQAAGGRDARALNGLGRAHFQLGHLDEARSYYRQALEADAEDHFAQNGLEAVEQAASSPKADRRAPADPEALKAARRALSEATGQAEGLAEKAVVRKEDNENALEGMADAFQSFTMDLNSISREINDQKDYNRAQLFNRGAAFYGNFVAALNALESANEGAGNFILDAQNALEEASSVLAAETLDASSPAFARNLADAASRRLAAADRISKSLTQYSADLQKAYDQSSDSMRELWRYGDQFDMPSLTRSAIVEAFDGSYEAAVEIGEAAEALQKDLREGRMALDAAVLDLNGSILDDYEAEAYRRMFLDRFGPDEVDLDGMLASGYGYGDLALAASKAAGRGVAMRDVAEGHYQRAEAFFDFLARNYGAPDGGDILLHFALNDLSRLRPRLETFSIETAGPADMAAPEEMDSLPESDPAMIGLRALEDDKPNDAVAALEKGGVGGSANPAFARRMLAVAYFEADRSKDAVDQIKELLHKNENDAFAHFLWGWIHLDDGDYESALIECGKADAMRPDYAPFKTNLGYLYLTAGDRWKAEDNLEKAVELQPGNAGYWNNLGIYYYRQGRKSKALEAFGRSLALDKSQPAIQKIVDRMEASRI